MCVGEMATPVLYLCSRRASEVAAPVSSERQLTDQDMPVLPFRRHGSLRVAERHLALPDVLR